MTGSEQDETANAAPEQSQVGAVRSWWRRLLGVVDVELGRETLNVECPHLDDPLAACDQCIAEARADRW